MQHSFDFPEIVPTNLVLDYLYLTRRVMPELALSSKRHWPVSKDHCFQRIVLDTVCGGVWADHIARPANKNLSHRQVLAAVQLCQEIITGQTDLAALNRQSLAWRGKSLRQDLADPRQRRCRPVVRLDRAAPWSKRDDNRCLASRSKVACIGSRSAR